MFTELMGASIWCLLGLLVSGLIRLLRSKMVSIKEYLVSKLKIKINMETVTEMTKVVFGVALSLE
jgi:hypothetical protein